MSNPIYLGATARLSAAFTDPETTAPLDPTGVQVTVKKADNSDPATYVFGTDSEVTKQSVGNYRAELPADVPGKWSYRWEGAGVTVAVGQGDFTVEATNV